MGRLISMDLRERAVAAVRSGMSRRQAAARFAVAPSTVVNWMKRADEEGRPIIGKVGGHRKFILEAELPWIRARLEQKPELSLRGLLAELNDRGLAVSPDLNPIEQVFAKLKALLRKEAPRNLDETCAAIGRSLDKFSPKECENYFRNSGYVQT